jgi:hypothetical protein
VNAVRRVAWENASFAMAAAAAVRGLAASWPITGVHEPGGGQAGDSLLVVAGPVAGGFAGCDQQRGTVGADAAGAAVDPAEAQGFFDNVVVGKLRVAAVFLPGDQPDAGRVLMVLGEPLPPFRPALHQDPLVGVTHGWLPRY